MIHLVEMVLCLPFWSLPELNTGGLSTRASPVFIALVPVKYLVEF